MDTQNTRTTSRKGNPRASSPKPEKRYISTLEYFDGQDPDDIEADAVVRGIKRGAARRKAREKAQER